MDETTLLLNEPSNAGDQSIGAVSPFGIWDLLRMIVVLAAVVGAVYGIFYLLKRSGKGKFVQNDSIRVLGAQTLPGNRNLYLVEVGSQVFLVGSGGDSVNLISEITDKESVDTLILRAGENGTGARRSFSELVSGIFKGNDGQSLGYIREQRERLQRLRQ